MSEYECMSEWVSECTKLETYHLNGIYHMLYIALLGGAPRPHTELKYRDIHD